MADLHNIQIAPEAPESPSRAPASPERFDDSEFLERLAEVLDKIAAIKFSLEGWKYIGEAERALGWIAKGAYDDVRQLYIDFEKEFALREAAEFAETLGRALCGLRLPLRMRSAGV